MEEAAVVQRIANEGIVGTQPMVEAAFDLAGLEFCQEQLEVLPPDIERERNVFAHFFA